MTDIKAARCVEVTDPNQYEEMIDIAMDVLGKNVRKFLDEIIDAAPHLAARVDEFRIEFEVERILTRDLAVAYASDNHTNWGIADWDALESKAKAAELDAKIRFRVKENSPTNRSLRAKVFALTAGTCAYCGSDITVESFHVDHVVPKARGGPDHFANYVPTCDSCNQRKHARHVVDFINSKTRN